ncbi:MAG: phosphatidate cytidylyltransferase [Parvularculaceae bacterium]
MTITDKSQSPVTGSGGTLVHRIVSAIILMPGALAATYAGGPVFAAVIAFACVVMLFEWCRMVEMHEFSPAFYTLSLTAAAALVCAAAGLFAWAFVAGAVGAAAAAMVARGRAGAGLWTAFGALYLIAPSIALLWLRMESESGRALTFLLFIIVWAADSGAYAAGRFVGGPKVSPEVSPAKTWAGIVGGVILGALAGAGAAEFAFGAGALPQYLLVGAALGLASVLGDVAESAFKRIFGVKDSSSFIPGHGGVLDRLDGMIFATSAMTLVIFVYILSERFQG